MAYYTVIPSELGEISLYTRDGIALSGLWLQGQKICIGDVKENPNPEIFRITQYWLNRYFSGENPPPEEIPLTLYGTPFQLSVWEQLRKIPYGTTVTYGDIAAAVGCRSAQAAGQAVGRNPVSIIVPCHRVIGKNGSLTGYAGGLDYKRALLKREGMIAGFC